MTSRTLKTMTAFAVGCLLSAGAVHADESAASDNDHGSAHERDIVGAWIVTVTPPGGAPPFLAFTSYMPRGIYISSPDRLPPVPGLGTAIGSAHGSWRSVGNGQFVSTHVEFRYGSAGEILGTVKLRASIQLTSKDGFEGKGQIAFCDTMLQHCSAPEGGLATVAGTRLPAEGPLP